MAQSVTAADLLPDFRTLFPEFDNDSDARVTIYLNLAISIFCKCTDATLYLAAHLLSIADSVGMSQSGSTPQLPNRNLHILPLTEADVSDKTAKFANIASMKDMVYTTTTYGVIYLQLKKACLGYVFTAGVSGGC